MNTASGRVLIAESNPRVTAVLRAHFANAGFHVDACADGPAALQFFQQSSFDAAVLDANLPEMGALDILAHIRGAAPAMTRPAVIVTGCSTHEDIIAALDAGASDCVGERYDVEELTARLRVRLETRRAERKATTETLTLTDALHTQHHRLEQLYEFGRDLSLAHDEDQIYDLVIAAVQKATGARRVSIMRYDALTHRLVCRRAVGLDPDLAAQLSIDPDSGIAGQVFTTGNAIVACAVNNETTADRHYAGDAYLSMPLVSTYLNSREKRLGVLNVTDKPDGGRFSTDEVEMLSGFAVAAAIALHNLDHETTLKRSIRALLLTVGRLSEYRDEDTGLHVERVRDYARILACQLAREPKFLGIVTPTFIEDLAQAAPLHDVGKVAIPDEILNKPGRLTMEEFQIMKTHTTIGRHTLNLAMNETGPIPLLRMCVDIAYCHHERWDGQGYPRGLKGPEIPLAARIVGLVDAYDAITSERCYKPATPHKEAVAIIRGEAGKHFDPDVAAAFLQVTDEFDRIRIAKADDVLATIHAAASAD